MLIANKYILKKVKIKGSIKLPLVNILVEINSTLPYPIPYARY